MPFTDSTEGQTHSYNDGCGEPEHNDVKLCKQCHTMKHFMGEVCAMCLGDTANANEIRSKLEVSLWEEEFDKELEEIWELAVYNKTYKKMNLHYELMEKYMKQFISKTLVKQKEGVEEYVEMRLKEQWNELCKEENYGNPTFYDTIVRSKEWKAWDKIAHTKGFDTSESIECGWFSPEHFKAFIKFIKSNTKLESGICDKCLGKGGAGGDGKFSNISNYHTIKYQEVLRGGKFIPQMIKKKE